MKSSSSCGSLGLEQIDRLRWTKVSVRLVLGGPKEFLVVHCPVKVGLRYAKVKNSDSALSNRMSRKGSVSSAFFSKVKIKQRCNVQCRKKAVTVGFLVEDDKNVINTVIFMICLLFGRNNSCLDIPKLNWQVLGQVESLWQHHQSACTRYC